MKAPHSAVRIVSVACAAFLLTAGHDSAAVPKGGDLKPGEAFVVLKVSGDVKQALFQRFQGSETFAAARGNQAQVIRVKPGRYYLKNVTPTHMGITLTPYLEPSEPSQTVSIREGVVTYIGDWTFVEDPKAADIRYETKLAFELIGAKQAVRRSGAADYKLMVAEFGKTPIEAPMP